MNYKYYKHEEDRYNYFFRQALGEERFYWLDTKARRWKPSDWHKSVYCKILIEKFIPITKEELEQETFLELL